MSLREEMKVNRALSALASVQTKKEYRSAKRLAARCRVENQAALIDSLIAARRRVEA